MLIVEDVVKSSVETYLNEHGYSSIVTRMGTRQGYDVEAVNPENGRRLVVECKGEASTGSQHARSWINVATAILTSLNEIYSPDNENDVAIALPDTVEYRGRLSLLNEFLKRESIAVFWISRDRSVVKE